MDMDWHILTMIPLVGLTAGWRGVRIGGKTLGMGGGLGSSNSPLVQAFDKAKAEGDRAAMERIAKQMNETRLKQNEAKASAKTGSSAGATRRRTLQERIAKGDRVVEAAQRRLSNLDKKMESVSDQIRVVEQAIREGKQVVETNRVAKRKSNPTPAAGGLLQRDVEYRVSKRKANASQLAKLDDRYNKLYGDLAALSTRRDQIMETVRRANKPRANYEFAKQRGLPLPE